MPILSSQLLTEKARKDWDLLAEHYEAFRREEGTYNEIVEMPAMLNLIGDVEGKTVLDAGCGPGQYSILLAKKGAEVTGIDISERMIGLAKKNAEKALVNCRFFVGDMQDLSIFKSSMFDLVTSSIVVGYLDDLRRAFSEVYRVLRARGVFTFSENHPIVTARADGWEKNRDGRRLHWNMDDYFGRSVVVDEWRTKDGRILETSSRHRTVQDYYDGLVSGGFVVERLVEPEPVEKGKMLNLQRYKRAERIPVFIMFRARKS